MTTLRQLQKRMHREPRDLHAGRLPETDVPLISADLDGAVITAYREGYFLVEMDGHRTAFSAFEVPERKAARDLNMRLPKETYLDLDWRNWPLIYGSFRILREQKKQQREHETPLFDEKRDEDRPDADSQNSSRERQVEEDVVSRYTVRFLRETVFTGMSCRWQKTVRLRFLEGESRETVAEELGCSPAVMRAVEYRLRRHIRKKLEKNGLN